MAELLPQNKDPLNQASKKALLQVNADADPSQLYCLQLADWALSTGNLDYQPELLENLEGLLAQNQEQAHEFLQTTEYPEDHRDPLGEAGPNPLPMALAVSILQNLHDVLTITAPYWPPGPET